jgi:hypothetical protein
VVQKQRRWPHLVVGHKGCGQDDLSNAHLSLAKGQASTQLFPLAEVTSCRRSYPSVCKCLAVRPAVCVLCADSMMAQVRARRLRTRPLSQRFSALPIDPTTPTHSPTPSTRHRGDDHTAVERTPRSQPLHPLCANRIRNGDLTDLSR